MKKSYLKKLIKEVIIAIENTDPPELLGFNNIPFVELKQEFAELHKWYKGLTERQKIEFDLSNDETNPVGFLISRGWKEEEAKKAVRFEELDSLRVYLANHAIKNPLNENLLNEALRGEWWIQDGQSVYADGDVGDINHEAHVINVLRSEILTYLGVDLVNYDYAPDFNDVADEILDNIKDELTKEEIEDWVEHNEYYNVIAAYLERKGDKNIKTKLSYLKGHNDSGQTMDAREYGLKHLGWIRVKGNEIQVNTLTSKDLKNITEGLYDAYNEELEKTNVQDVDKTNPMGEYTFNIDVLSTKSYYRNIPWSVLAKDDPTALNPYRSRY